MSGETVGANYSSNAAVRKLNELKKGAGYKLQQSRAPKNLWDDCIDFDAYVKSNATMIFITWTREVTNKVMSRERSDISQFYKLEWFEWVTF